MALAGTPEQAGAVLVHETVTGAVASLSVNLTSPPVAIVTLLAGVAEPGGAQHGHRRPDQRSEGEKHKRAWSQKRVQSHRTTTLLVIVTAVLCLGVSTIF